MYIPRHSLKKLTYFIATADAGTVTAAAKQLNISQSALSDALSNLENETGVQLLRRQKAIGVQLTDAGEKILKIARNILNLSEELETTLEEIDHKIQGELTIGCYPTLLPVLVPKLIVAMADQYPDIKLNFVEGTQDRLQTMIQEARLDAALTYQVGIKNTIKFDALFKLKPHILLSPQHHLADMEKIHLKDIYQDKMIMLDLSPSMINTASYFRQYGLEVNIWHRTSNYELVRSLVARNLGYSILMHRQKHKTSYEGLPVIAKEINDILPASAVGLIYEDRPTLPTKLKVLQQISKKIIPENNAFGI